MKHYNFYNAVSVEKFAGHTSASAWLCKYDDGAVALRSYNTTVSWMDTDGHVTVTGLYSATTIKHLGWFARYIGCTYYDLKRAYVNDCIYNVNTCAYIDPRTGEVLYCHDIDGEEYKTPDFKVA